MPISEEELQRALRCFGETSDRSDEEGDEIIDLRAVSEFKNSDLQDADENEVKLYILFLIFFSFRT